MLISLATLALLAPQTDAAWPDTVVFDCRFSQATHLARREEAWTPVTDLGGPEERIRLAVHLPSGAWELRGDWAIDRRQTQGVVEADARRFSFTVDADMLYDPEQMQRADFWDSATAGSTTGEQTWTVFAGPSDTEGAAVRTFVSARLVKTETGVCRRTER
jgi:hypothetical protein